MVTEDWDAELQQNQTAYTVATLQKEHGIAEGAHITLDLTFVPVEGANPGTFEKVLKTFGYTATRGEDGEISVEVPDIPFTFESVWTHEERTTTMALSRGYRPDGWGFWEP